MNIKTKKQQAIEKQQLLDALYAPYKKCLECPLGSLGRTNIVFGEGNVNAELMIIGEAPGKKEDEQAMPFVGKSGLLLNRALEQAEISRNDIFITNIVKCRPPKNRNPTKKETQVCKNLLLLKQIAIIQPKTICTLGSIALQGLLEKKILITDAKNLQLSIENSIIAPTYHPAYILRNIKKFDAFVQDLKAANKQSKNKK